MKVDKAVNTLLMFLAILMMLLTGFYANRIAIRNSVQTKYLADLSLLGSKLSDKVYVTANRINEEKNESGYEKEYEIALYNISDNSIANWKLFFDVPDKTAVIRTDGVGTTFTNKKNELCIYPENYNTDIYPYEYLTFTIAFRTSNSFSLEMIRFLGYQIIDAHNGLMEQIIILLIVVWTIIFTGYWVSKFNLRNYKIKQKNDVKIILQSMNTFISFIDAKDPYTRGHSKRVAMYAAEISKRMGLSEDEIQNVYYAGLLHDSGKISIPDAVLNKPGKLSDEERKLIQNHTVAGGKMLKQLSSIRGIRETALYHHERYDGSGYPEGLIGENIPLYARIVGVADSYDAMSSNRVYRRHLNKDEIIEEIQKGSGSQFDPEIVKYMVDMINDGYVNVVKMETADSDEGTANFHITESDIPGVYMGY